MGVNRAEWNALFNYAFVFGRETCDRRKVSNRNREQTRAGSNRQADDTSLVPLPPGVHACADTEFPVFHATNN